MSIFNASSQREAVALKVCMVAKIPFKVCCLRDGKKMRAHPVTCQMWVLSVCFFRLTDLGDLGPNGSQQFPLKLRSGVQTKVKEDVVGGPSSSHTKRSGRLLMERPKIKMYSLSIYSTYVSMCVCMYMCVYLDRKIVFYIIF